MNADQKNVDYQELDKFSALAQNWWDTSGELKTLHQINPIRLDFIKSKINLTDKTVLDVGCGGGILTESLSGEGAHATGIDMNDSLIQVAKLHAKQSKLTIHYHKTSVEDFAQSHAEHFDITTCLEMLEHVPDPASVIHACAKLTKPGGHLFFSTLNRHPKSYLFAILGAEYILQLLPKNTHDYAKFIKPSELHHWLTQNHLTVSDIKGMSYNPFTGTCALNDDLSVNYLVHAIKKL